MDRQTFAEAQGKEYSLIYGEPYKLDEKDKKILFILNKNARESLADIAKKVGISRDAVRNRIRRMLEEDVIQGFRVTGNPPKMGFPIINYVVISFHNPSVKIEEKCINYLKSHQNVMYVASVIGKWDCILYVASRNPGEFSSFMKSLRQKFPNLIKDYEVIGVLDELKWDEVPRF